jgi:outer membrane receptor for ferrienterochelin and colicins
MGGLVNIITKKVSPIWTGSVSSSIDFPDSGKKGETFRSGFSVSGPITDSLGIRLGGSYLKRDTDTYAEGSSGTKDHAFNGKLTWEANPNHSFYLEGKYGEQKPVNFPSELDINSETFDGGDSKNHMIGFGWDGRFGDVNTKLDIYMNRYKNERTTTSNGVTTPLDAASKEWVIDFKADTNITTFGIDQFLTAGVQYKKEEVYNDSNIGNILGFILEDGGTAVDPV